MRPYVAFWVVLWLLITVPRARFILYEEADLARLAQREFGYELQAHFSGSGSPSAVTLGVNPFVQLRVSQVRTQAVPRSGPLAPPYRYEAVLRWDTLFVLGFGFAALAYIGWPIYANSRVRVVFSRSDPGGAGGLQQEAAALSHDLHPDVSGRQLLRENMQHAQRRAADLDRYSTRMLVAGLMVAVTGITFFYVFTPHPAPGEDTGDLLLRLVRPLGIVLFIEGIAWFLLRRHRALAEDYKYFFRTYVQRTNCHIALDLVAEDGSEEARALKAALAVTLMQDHTPPLTGAQAPPAEATRPADDPPFNTLVRALVERFSRSEQK